MSTRSRKNLPRQGLLDGDVKEDYFKYGAPLYKASIQGDWKSAKAILEEKPELVRYSLTENCETALHVAASADRSKQVEEFVKNLVGLMKKDDLTLLNKKHNTALYLAAESGNLETVQILLEKNKTLHTIPGDGGRRMPLYAAALFGSKDVVKLLYSISNDLSGDGWNDFSRYFLIERCVEIDMFDIALDIVKKHPTIGRTNKELANKLLGVLARKPEAFSKSKSKYSFLKGTVNSVFPFNQFPEEESQALKLLRTLWEDILKLPKKDIDYTLKGPRDEIELDKGSSVLQAIQLQELVSEQLKKLSEKSEQLKKQYEQLKEQYEQDKKPYEQLKELSEPSEKLKELSEPSEQLKELSEPSKKLKELENTYEKEGRILVSELKELVSRYMLKMHTETQNIIKDENKTHSSKGDNALKLEKTITKNIEELFNDFQNCGKAPATGVKRLHGLISYHVNKMRKETYFKTFSSKDRYSSRVLFIAAEMGNTKFIVELICRYPDLIWQLNDDGLSIFHIAVSHRHTDIYSLLYEIGAMKDMITPLKDINDNNMLHLVAKAVNQKQPKNVTGIFEMQRDVLWFQEVKSIVPPSLREQPNSDGLTPLELFTKEHKDMVTQGEKWIKEIAKQCIVVAALIATMVFTAAFTVPGGYDQNNGIPKFYSETTFKIFVVADAISLFSSTASILYMFFFIFMFRYPTRDFLQSLPQRLVLGLSYLVLSITSMIVAFSVSFFVLYDKGFLWIPILISGFALIPFAINVKPQYILSVELISSRNLFKPKKHVLHYKNPKV